MTKSGTTSRQGDAAPTLLRISDTLSLRYQRSGEGPPLVLLHTIRTQLEYFRMLAPRLARRFTVYAVDLPGHGESPVDTSAPYDEPYIRAGVVAFLKALDLRDVTLLGESIGAVIALTAAADVPDRVRAVYALNTYDYETRYGDGIRRGNGFANLVIGSMQAPFFGAVGAAAATRGIIAKIMRGGYADPRNLPDDLVALFHKTGHRPHFHYAERKVLAAWRSWSGARARYVDVKAAVTLIYGDQDWSRVSERSRTEAALKFPRMFTLASTGHFSAVENPTEIARIVLS